MPLRSLQRCSPVLAAVALALPAGARQGTMRVAETIQLPSVAPDSADHATVAINEAGDLFVAWSSGRSDLGAGAFQVEGVFLPYLGSGAWAVPTLGQNYFILGAADAQVFGSGLETCRKPDVIAQGLHFYVTWPRSDFSRTLTRLEIVRVVPQAGGPPRIDAPAPGIGYVIDPALDGADGGVMPDAVEVSRSPEVVGVVYVDDEAMTPPYREYDLRYVRADFSALPPVPDGPYVLADNIAFDDTQYVGEPAGGKILPDVVLDDSGNLVVGSERYVRSGHGGALVNEGSIEVAWYSGSAAGAPAPLAFLRFGGQQSGDRVRRPNLASSRRDSSDSVSLAYVQGPDGPGDLQVQHHELFWDGVAITPVDLAFPNQSNRDDTLPVPAHGETLRLCLSDRKATSNYNLTAFAPGTFGGLRTVPSPAGRPWRPHCDLLEPPPPDMACSTLVPISYEASSGGGLPPRVYLVVHQR